MEKEKKSCYVLLNNNGDKKLRVLLLDFKESMNFVGLTSPVNLDYKLHNHFLPHLPHLKTGGDDNNFVE